MRHFSSLIIKQFRGLRNLEINGLGSVNLIVGPNNCGKSSVLDVIAVCSRPLDPLNWLDVARRREAILSRVSAIESLKWVFPQATASSPDSFYRGNIDISVLGDFQLRRVYAEFQEILTEHPVEENSLSAVRRGAELSVVVENEKDNKIEREFRFLEGEPFTQRDDVLQPKLPIKTITPLTHRVEQLQIAQYSESVSQEMKELIVSALRLFDDQIEDIEVLSRLGKQPSLYVRHSRLGYAPLSSFGDGLRRAVYMATTIPLCRDGIILVDEIETAIHTQMLEKVFAWFIEVCRHHNIQIFASTHSIEAIDAIMLSDQIKSELVLYRIKSGSHINSQATRLDKSLTTRLREDLGQEVRW